MVCSSRGLPGRTSSVVPLSYWGAPTGPPYFSRRLRDVLGNAAINRRRGHGPVRAVLLARGVHWRGQPADFQPRAGGGKRGRNDPVRKRLREARQPAPTYTGTQRRQEWNCFCTCLLRDGPRGGVAYGRHFTYDRELGRERTPVVRA